MLERELDQAGIATVEATQKVDGVGQIATRVPAGSLKQCIEVRMARGPVACDPRKLGFGDADRFAVDGPIDRHSYPLV